METFKEQIRQVLNPDSATDMIRKKHSGVTKSLRNCSGTINALDLIGHPVTTEEISKAEALIKANYGVDYPDEKFTMLWSLVKEEAWSSERLTRTIKWFLKTKKYPNWTIADFFEYEIKLHPYSWYLSQLHKGIKHDEMCAYRVNGQVYWTMDDGTELPLERV